MAGSGGVIVMDETTDLVAVTRAHHALLRARVVRPVHAVPRRHRLAGAHHARASPRAKAAPATSTCCASIAHGIAGNTICPLGEAAAWPMLGFLTKFRGEFEAAHPQGLPPEKRRQMHEVALRADPRHGLSGHGAAARPLMMRARCKRCSSPAASPRSSRPSDVGRQWPAPLIWWSIIAALHRRRRAVSTITRRNTIAAVMSLVAHASSAWRRSTRCCTRTSSPCCRCWSTPARSWCCSSSSSWCSTATRPSRGPGRGVFTKASSASSRSSTSSPKVGCAPVSRSRADASARRPPADVRHVGEGRRDPVHRRPVRRSRRSRCCC